jgi:hypothetical protein
MNLFKNMYDILLRRCDGAHAERFVNVFASTYPGFDQRTELGHNAFISLPVNQQAAMIGDFWIGQFKVHLNQETPIDYRNRIVQLIIDDLESYAALIIETVEREQLPR